MGVVVRILFWILLIFGGGYAGCTIDKLLFVDIKIGLFLHAISFIIGVGLLWLVMRISKNTGKTLAKYGRKGKIKRLDTNILVTQGIYKYMRHPMHLGLFLFPLSIAFMTGIISFIIIIVPAEIIIMLLLIKLIEEPEAISKFGNDYIQYKKNTPAFCLRIKCIKELFKTPIRK
jgi:protein-S-isoprenylcysteine O-methyltransferase Ste14